MQLGLVVEHDSYWHTFDLVEHKSLQMDPVRMDSVPGGSESAGSEPVDSEPVGFWHWIGAWEV